MTERDPWGRDREIDTDREIDYSGLRQMLFETTKQLTILSSGSIVVIGTFLSNIFPTDKHGILAIPNGIKLLIATAFVGFGGSLISATITMFFIHTDRF